MSRPPFTPAQLKRDVLPDLLRQIAGLQRDYTRAYAAGGGQRRGGEGGGRRRDVSDPTGEAVVSKPLAGLRRSVVRVTRDLERIGVLIDKADADLRGALGHLDPQSHEDLPSAMQYRQTREEYQAVLAAQRKRPSEEAV